MFLEDEWLKTQVSKMEYFNNKKKVADFRKQYFFSYLFFIKYFIFLKYLIKINSTNFPFPPTIPKHRNYQSLMPFFFHFLVNQEFYVTPSELFNWPNPFFCFSSSLTLSCCSSFSYCSKFEISVHPSTFV